MVVQGKIVGLLLIEWLGLAVTRMSLDLQLKAYNLYGFLFNQSTIHFLVVHLRNWEQVPH